MYHSNELNQVLLEKNLSSARFIHKDSQVDHYIGDINGYISTLTPFEQDIAHLFLKFRNAPDIFLTNQYIALLVACSRRTVTRATNKFHKDGFITKCQPNKYSSNHYTLNEKAKKGPHAFAHWFNSLPSTAQDLYISHGIIIDHKNKKICSDVTPNNSSLILDSLFRNPSPLAHACARGKGYSSEKHKRGVALVNEFQKKWIVSNAKDPRVKNMMNDPKIKAALITSALEKITRLLTLDEDEQLKLVVFSDKALLYAISCIEPIVAGKKYLNKKIDDKMGWLMSMLIAYSKEHKLPTDWKWYYDVCAIIGKDPKKVPVKKPLVITKSTVATSGVYKPWKAPKEDPIEDRVSKLKKDIEQLSHRIELNQERSYMLSYAMSLVEIKTKELRLLEAQLKKGNEDEKQIVSYQHSTYSMATCSA